MESGRVSSYFRNINDREFYMLINTILVRLIYNLYENKALPTSRNIPEARSLGL